MDPDIIYYENEYSVEEEFTCLFARIPYVSVLLIV